MGVRVGSHRFTEQSLHGSCLRIPTPVHIETLRNKMDIVAVKISLVGLLIDKSDASTPCVLNHASQVTELLRARVSKNHEADGHTGPY